MLTPPKSAHQQTQQDEQRSTLLWRRRISNLLIGDEIVADGRIVRRADANLYIVRVGDVCRRVSERSLGQTQRLVFDIVMGTCEGKKPSSKHVPGKQRAEITRRTTGVQRVESKGGAVRFRARASLNGRQVSLGTFGTEAEAVDAINAYIVQHGLKRPLLEVL